MIQKTDIKIGLQFIPITGKRKDKTIHTLEDIYKTYNSKNELVKTVYITSKMYIGQKLFNYSGVSVVTIQRSELIKN